MAIAGAEREIERYVGKPLVPKRRDRLIHIPHDYSPYFGFKTRIGPHLEDYVPYKAVSLGTVSVPDEGDESPTNTIVFSDMDGDTLNETVTLTLSIEDAVDPESVVVYLPGEFGELAGRIRPLRGVAVSADTLTITLDCWQVVDRRIQRLPRCAVSNLLYDNIYVTSLEIGYMALDRTVPQATFYYEEETHLCGLPSCTICEENILYGVTESSGEWVTVYPATLNEETGEYERVVWDVCGCMRQPYNVKITYYESYCAPTPRSELCEDVKMAIALLAGARLQTGTCDCECTDQQWLRSLNKDTAVVSGQGRYTTQARLDCPFGTLHGEQMAYDRLRAGIGLVVRSDSF
jgi:hypothetical protein